MRDISAQTMAQLDLDRVINARITVRDLMPRFTEDAITDTTVASATCYDSDYTGSGLLRVANVGGALYHQYSTSWSSFGSWTNSSIALKANSGVALYGNRLFYQDSAGQFRRRDWSGSAWGAATAFSPSGMNTGLVAGFAPVSATSVFCIQSEVNVASGIGNLYHSTIFYYDGSVTKTWPGVLYDVETYPHNEFDAIRMTNPNSQNKDFVFFASGESRKAEYITFENDDWGQRRDVFPLDFIDDTSQFRLGSVTEINNTLWVTGRLVRGAGTDLQVYSRGFEDGDWDAHFTLGREMFICEHSGTIDNVKGKLFHQNNAIYFVGLNHRWSSTESMIFGVDLASRKLLVNDVVRFTMSCGRNTPTSLTLQIDVADDDALFDHGNQIDLEIAYGDQYSSMGKFMIEGITRNHGELGDEMIIRCVDEVCHRLSYWGADADYDYWSPHKLSCYAKDLTKLLRKDGEWEESGNALINNRFIPSNLNAIDYLTCVERPSRNGLVAAKFDYTPDQTGLVNEFGVIMQLYKESEAEVKERLETYSSHDYGLEGILARFGEDLVSSADGVEIAKFMPAFPLTGYSGILPTILAEYSYALGDITVWIAATYTDGVIRMYIRDDASTDWYLFNEIRHEYDYQWPTYLGQGRGRSGLFINNRSDYVQTRPFRLESDYIAYHAGTLTYATMPSSGTLRVENEVLTWNGKDSNSANGYINLNFAPDKEDWTKKGADHDNAYTGPFTGYPVWLSPKDPTTRAHDYYNDMVLVVTDGPGKGNVWKITDYDYTAPYQWVDTGGPYTWPDTWVNHVGDSPTYGDWADQNLRRVFVLEDPGNVLGEGSVLAIQHRLDINLRGQDDTIATGHDDAYAVLSDNTPAQVEDFLSIGGDRELSFDYIATDIARKAGVWDVTSRMLESGSTALSHAGWSVSADHTATWHKEQNAIIDMYATSLTTEIGIATLPETLDSGSEGYICTVTKFNDPTPSYVKLYSYGPSSAITLLEKVPIAQNVENNERLTFAIHDNFILVYVSDALVWGFSIDNTQEGTCIVAYDSATVNLRWPEADVRVDNFICDMGSSGLSNLSRLIGEKHIFFHHDEGTLEFFVDRDIINTGDPYDLVIDTTDEERESPLVTRLRIEGVDLYERIDATNMKQYGNVFHLSHSNELNSLGELEEEARRRMEDYNSGINTTRFVGAADPRVEPDDIFYANIVLTERASGATRDIIVDSVSFMMDITDNQAVFDMEVDGRDD